MRRMGWATAALLVLACGGNTNGNDGDDDDTTLDGSGGTEATSTTATSVTDDAGATGSTNANTSTPGQSASGGSGGSGGTSEGSGGSGGSDGSGGSSGGRGGRGGTGGDEPVQGTPAPEDFPEFAKGPYGYCAPSSFGGTQMYCPENSASGGGSENCLEWCSCQVSCTSDADCPEPETGSSQPVCDGGGCRLPCAASTCPDGMRCLESNDGAEECVWAREGEENLACWLFEHPEHCEQFTTKEACQERIDTDPLQPQDGCIWMIETIHSTASPTCDPAAVSESCVPGTRQDYEPEGLSCPESESWVHFRDIGAGTAALMITDRYRVPGGPLGGVSGQPCSFGEPTLPLLCDCACEL